MGDAGGEHNCRAALSESEPMVDDVANQLRLVHALGELRLDVVTTSHRDTGEIG
jgi:hypothetical protein